MNTVDAAASSGSGIVAWCGENITHRSTVDCCCWCPIVELIIVIIMLVFIDLFDQ
jgi:hypothetical protein